MPKVLRKGCTQSKCGLDKWFTQISSFCIHWDPDHGRFVSKGRGGGRIKESVFVTECPGVGDVAGPDSIF